MKPRKTFAAPPPVVVATAPNADETADALVIDLPENPSTICTLDLRPWRGRGIDGWVWAVAGQLRAFLAGNSVTPATVVGYWREGASRFFEFLVSAGGPNTPQAIEPKHVRQYVRWLQERSDLAYGTQKNRYDTTKSVLRGLQQRGLFPNHPDLFPATPFPRSHTWTKGETPLSPGERRRLVQALRNDLVAIHKGQFAGTGSQALVVHLLAIAIRTGRNTTPFLEMPRDCLEEHPFMPNMKLLRTVKRRGNTTHRTNLRFPRGEERPTSIPIEGVALVNKVLAMTAPLLGKAKGEHQDRVWLYQSETGGTAGQVTALTRSMLYAGIAALIERHALKDDQGGPLRLNLSRLRKTLEHRLFSISGGDLLATAALMGHSPQVADLHYLACTQEMRENATFVGEALPDIYGSGNGERRVIPLHPDPTPLGRCKDTLNGQQAPKDGTACDNFLACFRCTSYAIVGSPQDLHRLFSFYWFLDREILHARSNPWREEFRWTMALIDRFTLDLFDNAMVEAAKECAHNDPIKFWASYTLEEVVNG